MKLIISSSHLKKIKYPSLLICILLLVVLCCMGWIKVRRSLLESEQHLAIRWEGLYKDKNFRDIGDSINQCYGKEIMRTGLVFRSNGWFSGWNCNKVGNPEIIYSLNFDPKKNDLFFCWDAQKKQANICKVLNLTIKLSDLEFLPTWGNEEMRKSTCTIFKSMLVSIKKQKRTLIHCSAGRDRTGVFAAILAAIAAESRHTLNQSMLDAIECDYRKTASLVPEKYGRMEEFIRQISKTQSVSHFLASQCNIPEETIKQTGSILAEN
jgi:hypothetical protein